VKDKSGKLGSDKLGKLKVVRERYRKIQKISQNSPIITNTNKIKSKRNKD